MKNQYSIIMNVNNAEVNISEHEFNTMFETFLWYIENALYNKHVVKDVVLKYKDNVVATTTCDVLHACAGIANFDIMVCKPGKSRTQITELSVKDMLGTLSFNPVFSEDVQFYVVDRSKRIYDVFPNIVLRNEIITYLMNWKQAIGQVVQKANDIDGDFVINAILTEPVGTERTMKYYINLEVKKALELIDTNPAEAKSLLIVLDYILNS